MERDSLATTEKTKVEESEEKDGRKVEERRGGKEGRKGEEER